MESKLGVNLRDIAKPKKIELEDLAGQKVAIDAFNTLYQFLSIIRGMSGDLLKDNQGRVTSHLSGLFYRNINLIEIGITPIFVFDGAPPKLKSTTIERRREVKVVAAQAYKVAIAKSDFEQARKFASATAYLTDEMIQESKQLLDLMGISWLQAPSEGEATAAHLTNVGVVDYAGSQDYDSLLFGAKKLARNITISGKRKLPNSSVRVDVIPESVALSDVLGQNGITREQLVDIGILLGTDFNPDGFEKIGPATALKLVKKHGKIEHIPQLQGKVDFDVEAIREIFLKPQVLETADLDTKLKTPKKEELLNFLCAERAFSEDRVLSSLQRIEARQEKESQSLEQWFK